jgi:Protein phosphatase inhibitor
MFNNSGSNNISAPSAAAATQQSSSGGPGSHGPQSLSTAAAASSATTTMTTTATPQAQTDEVLRLTLQPRPNVTWYETAMKTMVSVGSQSCHNFHIGDMILVLFVFYWNSKISPLFLYSPLLSSVFGCKRDEGVVDNEGLGRKSSKRCCIFHKQRAFGESSTDSSDYDDDDDKDGSNGDKKIARKKKGGKKKTPDHLRFHA